MHTRDYANKKNSIHGYIRHWGIHHSNTLTKPLPMQSTTTNHPQNIQNHPNGNCCKLKVNLTGGYERHRQWISSLGVRMQLAQIWKIIHFVFNAPHYVTKKYILIMFIILRLTMLTQHLQFRNAKAMLHTGHIAFILWFKTKS